MSVVIPRSREAATRIAQRYHPSKVRLLRRHPTLHQVPPTREIAKTRVSLHMQRNGKSCSPATSASNDQPQPFSCPSYVRPPATQAHNVCVQRHRRWCRKHVPPLRRSLFTASSLRDCVRVIRLLWYQRRKWKLLCPTLSTSLLLVLGGFRLFTIFAFALVLVLVLVTVLFALPFAAVFSQ